ncbi:MAG: MBL fold metallo-hydrolase [bacterium]|nr:MBL fold metallo-hydrolase [bacterium]
MTIPLQTQDVLKIYFLDVRQGDCTLIVTPNKKAVLIDCNNGYQTQPLTVLNNLSVQTLNYIIATHSDADHTGALDEVISDFGSSKVKVCFDHGGTYGLDWTNATLGKRKTINVGTNITIDSNITLFCMASGGRVYDPALGAPYISSQLDTTDNGLSVVCLVRYKNFDVWIGGDATQPIEDGCINAINSPSLTGDGNISVLRVDHHGSQFCSYASFLTAVNPLLSIISSGGDAFGHPTQTTIDRLEAVNPFNYIYCTEAPGCDGGTPSAGRGVRLGTAGDAVLDGSVNLETDGYYVKINGEMKITGGIVSAAYSTNQLQNNGIHKLKVETVIGVEKEVISNVYLNWSSLGGRTNLMYDDATHGDNVASNLIYTYTNIRTTKPAGDYTVSFILVQTNGSNIIKNSTVTVIEDVFPPIGESFRARYTNGYLHFQWKNPPDIDQKSVQLRYNLNTDYPLSTLDGSLITSCSTNLVSREYNILYPDVQFYNRYYFTVFFSDYKNNVSRLNADLLALPLSSDRSVFLSDNFLKPGEKKEVEFIFDGSVVKGAYPRVEIFNMNGIRIKTLKQIALDHIIRWDLTNQENKAVGSGIYIALINLPDRVIRKKILVAR